MLRDVSFNCPPRGPMPSATMGGSLLTTLKNENGAAFKSPRADWLTTHAIGRGTTTLDSSLKASADASLLKSKFMVASPDVDCGRSCHFASSPSELSSLCMSA
ncbi:hypothetical protein D3C71_1882890 [compost metagenome]